MEIAFYQLTATSLEKTLPRLLDKIYNNGQRAVVLVDTQERLDLLNASLWTYSTAAFLPHGSKADAPEFHSRQPIWLTTALENPNQANVLVVTSGEYINKTTSFEKCLDLFDGNDPKSLADAQKRYQQYQQAGLACTYWRQTLEGGWENISKA